MGNAAKQWMPGSKMSRSPPGALRRTVLPFESMPELSIEPGLLPEMPWDSMEGPVPADVPGRARQTLTKKQSSCAYTTEPHLFSSTTTEERSSHGMIFTQYMPKDSPVSIMAQ